MTTRKKNNKRLETVVAPTSAVTEEYTPSANADKYNVETPQHSYRILSYTNDYYRLQEDVTKLLNQGWSLAGGVSVAIHANQYAGTTVFSQAVYKLG